MAKCLTISEQDRAEAATVTSRGEGHQFEIQLGHLCNNRCVFCSSGQLTELKIARHIPLDPMIAAIEEARASGARRITFLGGEPTLHKGFLAALRRTVELGFEEIVIFTNGVLLPHPGFIDKVVALGRFEWRISIQGGNEEAHVAVTKRRDSFQRIVRGLEMLRERGQLVTANMCVNELSYRSLPDYVPMVREYGIRQLHIDVIRPSSIGECTEEYLREIMPRYSDMAPYLAQMLEGFERVDPSFDVNVGNLPFCILPEWAHRIHHGGEETITKACDSTDLEVAVDKYEWHASMRQHPPACAECAFRPQCTGVFSTYLAMNGDSEFQPVTLGRLRRIDPARHHFVLLVEPFLAPLEEALRVEAEERWALVEWRRDTRSRSVDVRLTLPAGGVVTLRFVPPEEQGDGVLALRTDQYDLRVFAGPEVDEGELSSLLTWVGERLSDPSVEVRGPLDLSGVLSAHAEQRLHAAGRAKVEELVRRVEAAAPFGDWSLIGRRDELHGTVLGLSGPDGALLDVVFAVRGQPGRPTVALDARLRARTSEAIARRVVEQIVRRIRGEEGGAALSSTAVVTPVVNLPRS